MKTLKAQPFKPAYSEPTRKRVLEALHAILFSDIIELVKQYSTQTVIKNAGVDALLTALKNGRIRYADGMFTGQLSAAISKQLRAIGATFDKTRKAYKLPANKVPPEIRSAISFSDSIALVLHEKIKDTLKNIETSLGNKVAKTQTVKADTVKAISVDFQKVVKAITVAPQIGKEAQERLASDYNDNMKLYIKTFAEEEIKELRSIVDKNAMAGYRFDTLIAGIQQRYDVTKNKAKFLARQETSLLMSKFRKERFRELGVNRYRWSARPNARPDHRALNGQVFAYASPPITNRATGARNNPGEDFNCLCIDIPILE